MLVFYFSFFDGGGVVLIEVSLGGFSVCVFVCVQWVYYSTLDVFFWSFS
jgi:hypothetical protein